MVARPVACVQTEAGEAEGGKASHAILHAAVKINLQYCPVQHKPLSASAVADVHAIIDDDRSRDLFVNDPMKVRFDTFVGLGDRGRVGSAGEGCMIGSVLGCCRKVRVAADGGLVSSPVCGETGLLAFRGPARADCLTDHEDGGLGESQIARAGSKAGVSEAGVVGWSGVMAWQSADCAPLRAKLCENSKLRRENEHPSHFASKIGKE